MGRIGQFFSNFGNKVKNFGLRIGSTLSHIAPKALHYGRMIANGLSNVPGFIGTAAGAVYKGLNAADRVINALPESGFKSKLKSLENSGVNTVNKVVDKANQYGKTAKTVGDTANTILNAAAGPII